jgi:D-alanyl-D-alanine carboxypeptidase
MAPENRANRQRVGDLISHLGRILSACSRVFVVLAILVTSPLQAAPFAAIVMDGRTGEILYEKNAHTRLHPASLTKMMTLYITFQDIEAGRLSLDTKVTVTKYAASQPPSRLGLKPGQKIALRYLIRAAAVKSANDAAAAIGDHIGGDAATFAKRMTRTARQLGMTDTTFKNANGLTAEGHMSTAYDMNVLGRHLFYDFPQYYNIFSRRTADAGIATVANTNTRFLDSYEGADGIKTGYTSPAGFNLTASARRGNKHIIATVFGGTSTANRNAKMAELMDLGFGEAKNRVKEQPPVAPIPEDALIASAEPAEAAGIDDINAEGGAGKTVRVSGAVSSSPRPKARPTSAPEVPEPVAVAMAEGIAGALAEAASDPAPAGTLDFQAEAIASVEPASPQDAAPAAADVSADAVADIGLAAVETPALVPAVPEPGSLDAQAAALATGLPPAETALAALAPEETAPVAEDSDPALLRLAEVKPRARPEGTDPSAAPAEEVAVAAAEPAMAAPELVVTDPGLTRDVPLPLELAAADLPVADLPVADLASPDTLAAVTDVQTVAASAVAMPLIAPAPDAGTAPARKAPVFDAVDVAKAPAEEATEKVVVVMSTSGGRHFGVNVGEFASRYDAERALLKTALAESATLNEGLRKTSQSDGAWRASFLGLTEEQAELACRRLRARAVPCETVGG